jgi:prevent-host-death family protein
MTDHREIPLKEARAHLGQIIHDAQVNGQPVVITRNGRPVAEITPIVAATKAGR